MTGVILKAGRERSVARRHPWIFSGAIDRVEGDRVEPGNTVEVVGADGQWLARGAWSPHSQIRIRVWTWEQPEAIDAAFLRRQIERAVARRATLAADGQVDAYRLIHAESDGLPGLIVDRYGGTLVVQILSAGVEYWRRELFGILVELSGITAILERSDVDVRQLEGLPSRKGMVDGELPAQPLIIHEGRTDYFVDVLEGQKTGFYLDQRDNRRAVERLAVGKRVLNCFCYTGGFNLAALAAGAEHVLSIDTSGPALKLAARNLELNGYPPELSTWVEGDVFHELRRLRDRRESFDAIILDPPRFAPSSAQRGRGARGYKDINLLAFRLLRPGGRLVTFSCSGGIGPELFQKIVADAALDAGVSGSILGWLGQPEDHPVRLSFPEGRYLKGLICQSG
jgi:23S rRNA (cytosine1962-C5)-methyltransferase